MLTLIQSWSQSKLWEEKHFSFFFPNTAEQTPPKYQGSVSFQKLRPFDKWSKPDISLVLIFVLVEPKCSNATCLQCSQAAEDRFLKATLVILTCTSSGNNIDAVSPNEAICN